MRLAIDSMIFIYAMEDSGERGDLAVELIKRLNSSDGELTAAASALCLAEVLVHPWRLSEAAAQDAQGFMESIEYLDYVPMDVNIAIWSARLRSQNSSTLRLADAVHLATAISCGAEAFVTEDTALLTVKIKGLPMLRLKDLKL